MKPTQNNPTADIVHALGTDSGIGEVMSNPAVMRLTNAITDLRHAGTQVHGDLATYRWWARTVARYSFDTYQLYTARDHIDR